MKVFKPVVGRFPPSWHILLLGLIFLTGVNPVQAQENVETNQHGLLIKFGQAQVELAAATPDALRLSVAYDGKPRFIPSSFLADANAADSIVWQIVKKHGMVGIRTKAGELLISPRTGEWTLLNAAGKVLIPRHEIGGLNQETSSRNTNVNIMLGWDKHKPISVYACGNGVDTLQQSKTTTRVSNGRAVVPYYWSAAGYAVLAVTANDNRPARWQGATNGEYLTWTFPGREAELYLMPAASLKDATEAGARLTGFAPVPPRWTFGYLQSRWGWKDRAYIEDTLKQFRDLKIPVDAFIYDFEWYTTNPDYKLPSEGVAGFDDFGWNTNLFSDPVEQIQAYKNQGVHFVGIRKPRSGNRDTLAMIRAKGWNLQIENDEKYHFRDVNFGNPEFREWYIGQSAGLLRAGIDGWWNDEGESALHHLLLLEPGGGRGPGPIPARSTFVDTQPRLFPRGAAAGCGGMDRRHSQFLEGAGRHSHQFAELESGRHALRGLRHRRVLRKSFAGTAVPLDGGRGLFSRSCARIRKLM